MRPPGARWFLVYPDQHRGARSYHGRSFKDRSQAFLMGRLALAGEGPRWLCVARAGERVYWRLELGARPVKCEGAEPFNPRAVPGACEAAR